uniref:Uncharacterized protein n=1 Tax=Plectus sambesii TaxID=2011161 RepID=A0A914V926_9BILA
MNVNTGIALLHHTVPHHSLPACVPCRVHDLHILSKSILNNARSRFTVSTPPIPPSLAGACQKSRASGREVCYPRYEDLDTSCTDVSGTGGKGLVAPPTIQHA